MSRDCENNYHITRRVNKVACVHAQTVYFVPCFFFNIKYGAAQMNYKLKSILSAGSCEVMTKSLYNPV